MVSSVISELSKKLGYHDQKSKIFSESALNGTEQVTMRVN